MKKSFKLCEIVNHAGEEIGVSKWHVVDQSRIDDFGACTGDDGWIHSDVERSTREMGGTIAQGFLTLSMIVAMWYDFFEMTGFKNGYNYGLGETRFTAPVRSGARVRCRATLLEPRWKNGGVLVGAKIVVEVEGEEKPALVTSWTEIYYPLDEEAEAIRAALGA